MAVTHVPLPFQLSHVSDTILPYHHEVFSVLFTKIEASDRLISEFTVRMQLVKLVFEWTVTSPLVIFSPTEGRV